MTRRILLIILLFSVADHASAQDLPINFYKITNEDGLSQATVNVLFKDSQGFLWLGTDDGLNRFNGKQFKKYYYKYYDDASIAANEIYAICEDKAGKIWVSHYNGGISVLDKKTDRFTRLQKNGPKNKSLLSDRIYGLHHDQNGFIWARSLQGLSRIDPRTFNVQNFGYPALQDVSSNISNADLIETSNHIWMGSNSKGIVRITKDGRLDPLSEWDQKENGVSVSGIYKESEERIFVLTEKGFFVINRKNNQHNVESIIRDGVAFKTATKVARFSNSSVFWIGTKDKGIIVVDIAKKKIVKEIKSETVTDNLISNAVFYLLRDDEQNMFVATGRGLNVFSPYSSLFNIYENAFRKISDFGHPIYAIHELFDGNLLVGTKHRGLYIFDTKSYKATAIHLPEKNIAANNRTIYSITPFAHNQYLVSSGKGIFGLTLNKNIAVANLLKNFPELKKIDTIAITGVFVLNDSLAYVASLGEGMFKWNYKSHTLRQYKKNDIEGRKGPVDNQVMKIVSTTEGNMVVCTRVGFSIYYPSADTFLNIFPGKNYPHQLPAGNVKYAFDDGKDIWVTTFGAGVQKFNKKSRTFSGITTREGLPNDAVYAAIPANDGHVYISTNNGLAAFNLKDKSIRTFTTQDGLPDNEFNGYAGYKSSSGKIFFSTLNGLVSINNRVNISNPYSPNVVLTRFFARGSKQDSSYNPYNRYDYEIPAGLNSLILRFASLSYAAPEKNDYKVMLEGFDDKWIDLKNENEITYPQLPPGNYVFNVMATNNSGVWSKKKLSINITVLPFWYQTWWFLLLLALITVAIFYAMYRYRITQLTRVAEMRQKISSDLHDDIGATLSSNKIYTTLARKAPDNTKYIDLIEGNLNTVIKSLDEMVWSINPKNDTVWALSEHMNSYACPILAANNINCHFITNLKEVELSITPKQRRHLFLSLKEMMNNVIKHSNCKNCYINFSKKNSFLYVEVRDDGDGFEKERVNTTRNGLHSLGFRAKEVKGRFTIDSEPGKGTTARMVLRL